VGISGCRGGLQAAPALGVTFQLRPPFLTAGWSVWLGAALLILAVGIGAALLVFVAGESAVSLVFTGWGIVYSVWAVSLSLRANLRGYSSVM
jgi:hypothetical protein